LITANDVMCSCHSRPRSANAANPRQYVRMRAEDFGVSWEQLLGHARPSWLVAIRRAIARELRRKEFSYSEIGRALNRDHSTIMYLLDPEGVS